MKARFEMLFCLCVVLLSGCTSDDDQLNECNTSLDYDYVIQKYIEAGFERNEQTDSLVDVIRMTSPEEAMLFLRQYIDRKESRNLSRAIQYIKINERQIASNIIECSFFYGGLSIYFRMSDKCEILTDSPLRIEFSNKEYKIEKVYLDRGDIARKHYPILSIQLAKPLNVDVNGEQFVGKDILSFRFELILNEHWAILR